MLNQNGRFGNHGGQYIPETLMNAVIELENAYEKYQRDPEFNRELGELLNQYAGRPSRLYFASHMTEDLGGAKIYLKREDLNHTGSHKINNVLGQALCPLLHVTLQNTTLPASSCSILCGAPQGYVPSCRRKSGTEKIQEIFGWFSQWTNSGVSAKIDAVRFSRCPGENFANVIFATMQTYILCARMVKHHNICNIKIQICIQAVYRRDEEKVHERYQTEQHGSKF